MSDKVKKYTHFNLPCLIYLLFLVHPKPPALSPSLSKPVVVSLSPAAAETCG